MSRNRRLVPATPEQVWSVLADGWTYSSWVVGASRMRDVSPEWPHVGAELHHSAGVWPAVIDDTTSVLEVQEGHTLVLRARGWPAGEAHVRLTLETDPSGGTVVVIEEQAVRGPGALVPGPVQDLVLHRRNDETLRRLSLLASRGDPGKPD